MDQTALAMNHLHGGYTKELADTAVDQSLKTPWYQSEGSPRGKARLAMAISFIHQDGEVTLRIPANAQGKH